MEWLIELMDVVEVTDQGLEKEMRKISITDTPTEEVDPS